MIRRLGEIPLRAFFLRVFDVAGVERLIFETLISMPRFISPETAVKHRPEICLQSVANKLHSNAALALGLLFLFAALCSSYFEFSQPGWLEENPLRSPAAFCRQLPSPSGIPPEWTVFCEPCLEGTHH